MLKRPEERIFDALAYVSSSSTEVLLKFGGALSWMLR